MSAGAFQRALYEADNGDKFNTRTQPETQDTTPANPSAVSGSGDGVQSYLKMTKGSRERGIIPRRVVLRPADPATVPDGYKEGANLTIPILTPAAFEEFRTAAEEQSNVTYLNVSYKVLSLIGERVNY